MTISTTRIGAKMVLYEDGTAAVSVFLIEADGQQFLTYEVAADRGAAEAIVHARASDHGVRADDIEIRYNDTRASARAILRPMPGKAH